MAFFDFLFYNMYRYFADRRDGAPASSSAILLGGFFTMNFLALYICTGIISKDYFLIDKFYAIILMIIFQIYTHLKYVRKKQNAIEKIGAKWLDKTQANRADITRLHYLYSIGSIVIFFWLAVYVGFKRSA
ncbi:MAG: hypothetical protein DI535_05535 [Citrobacter freundii]|nr:MAG: hypothetical protein DI535_05535 [Citrobacter freundii]